MKERPILFSAPMVRAILEGRKTQTRRVKKFRLPSLRSTQASRIDVCPYGAPSDRLWVRETWKFADWTDDGYPYVRFASDGAKALVERGIPEEWSERLTSIWEGLSRPENFDIDGRAADRRWRPAIHMPRWASRITLEITDVRVQRLQDIALEDIDAEGFPGPYQPPDGPYLDWFISLWDSINAKRAPWSSNPLVWAITFEPIQHGTEE